MAILDDVKTSLRIKHTQLDSEITGEIAACKTDLSMAGVVTIEDTDELTASAIKLYCRGLHDYNGQGEKYAEAYGKLKNAMALSSDYNEAPADG